MKNNLFSFLLGFTLLALNCISCSHNKAISADAGLTDESAQVSSSEEGSSSTESAPVSENAESKAEDLVGKTESEAPLEATATDSALLGEDPVLLGMESSVSPEDGMQVAQASQPEQGSDANSILDKTVSAPTDASSSSFGALSNTEKKAQPARKIERKVRSTPPPKVEPVPEAKKEPAPPVASNIDDPFADELNAPIPQPEKPKLASAEIGSFIERHVFLVTLCAVAFVFGVFIFMRRKNDREDHNLTV